MTQDKINQFCKAIGAGENLDDKSKTVFVGLASLFNEITKLESNDARIAMLNDFMSVAND